MSAPHFKYYPARFPKTLTIPETTLYDNLVTTAKRYPNKTAIEYYGSTLSYKSLLAEADQLAGYLEKKLGVKPGDNILLFMQNSPQFIVSLFAIFQTRAVVVPINPMSTTRDLEFFINDGDIKMAIVGQELYDTVTPHHERGLLENVIVTAYGTYANPQEALGTLPAEVVAAPKEIPSAIDWFEALESDCTASPYEGKSDDVAVIPYTSGTTGTPKGCVHTNKTIQSNAFSAYHWLTLTSNTVTLTVLPLFHVTGFLHSCLAPIIAGGKMVLLTRWDRDYAAKAIEVFQCTHWINISTMVVDFLANPNLSAYDVSSLQAIGGGGAPLPEAVGERLTALTGIEYAEGYGLSETMSHTHFNPPDRPKLQCMGIPAFNTESKIIDPVTGNEVGVGEEGELIVRGPQVFIGYYNNPEETEANHIEVEGKRFFRTGDIVKKDEDGYYFIVDRVKRMINTSGFKVWPTEVESILYKHPAVQQACVVRAPDEKRGETVKAFIILKDDGKGRVTEEEIIEWSKGQMAAYKYPRIIEFRDEFPTTASGKILWRELQDS
ncbi:long-chain-fatty-acid--CoA ligase [Sporosarcina ureilytica]|uniref:long-chain-fatty-acid--CoA ligase n=1 Tax=Sporosarcina ureilytica TaxID=298596 RepID=UPI00094C79CF|nr:long-chain-fatty-acid--CoA ligase [Sporosarcina ureilytica]